MCRSGGRYKTENKQYKEKAQDSPFPDLLTTEAARTTYVTDERQMRSNTPKHKNILAQKSEGRI